MEEIALPHIEGQGFTLRPFKDEDARSLQQHINDKRVARDVSHIPYPYTLAHAKAWIEQTSAVVNDRTKRVDFVIDVDGDVVGSVAFINLERKNYKAQVSYWLHPDFWKRGIMTEALKHLVSFGFDTLELFRIYGYVYAENEASAGVLQRAGFTFEGIHTGEWVKVIDGTPRQFDSRYYAIARKYREANAPRVFAVMIADGEDYVSARTNAQLFAKHLRSRGCEVRFNEPARGDEELAIAFGGDGTMMRVVRMFSKGGVPTFGVNAGDVGFLTSAEAAEWHRVAEVVLDRSYCVERRLGLSLRKGGERFGPFANEITLFHPTNTIASFTVSINGEPVIEDLSANGVLVSTATGSTAYNASVGGPIIFPSSSNVVVSAINPMRLSTRSIVFEELASGGVLTIMVTGSKRGLPVSVAADELRFDETETVLKAGIAIGESIAVKRHFCPLLFATLGHGQYVEALKGKKGFAR
ncbi:MAG: GNAT family N-acetyltransferase [Candidatus Paceibacterota bacterium]